MRNKKVLLIVQAALIAAIYVVLTYFISAFNLASGAIQVRISEALTILPVFTPAPPDLAPRRKPAIAYSAVAVT